MKKGVSLISLGIIVIILGLIASAVIIGSADALKSIDKTKFVTDYMAVEQAVTKYYSTENSYPTSGTIILSLSGEYDESELEGETIQNGSVTLSKIDLTKLGVEVLTFGVEESADDVFAVSTTTGKVYYVKGFKHKSKMYYTVTDDLK